jgi:hypothetical protein
VFCPACSAADGDVIYTGTLEELCPGDDLCSLAMLECFSEEGRKLLSPSCAEVFTSLFEQHLLLLSDGGGSADACNPQYGGQEGTGVTFCSAIGGCVGGTTYCEGAICPACSAVDGIFLGSGDQLWSFGGLCPALLPANPCADFQCLLDAGPKILSPSCARAVTSLIESSLDGGLDAG